MAFIGTQQERDRLFEKMVYVWEHTDPLPKSEAHMRSQVKVRWQQDPPSGRLTVESANAGMIDVLFPSEDEAIVGAKDWLDNHNYIEVVKNLFLGTNPERHLMIHLCKPMKLQHLYKPVFSYIYISNEEDSFYCSTCDMRADAETTKKVQLIKKMKAFTDAKNE